MADTASIQNGNLISTSEKVLGLVLEGKQSATFFDPDKLFGEYGKALRDLKRSNAILNIGNVNQINIGEKQINLG